MNQIKFKNNLVNNRKIINKKSLTTIKISKKINSIQSPLHSAPIVAPDPKNK